MLFIYFNKTLNCQLTCCSTREIEMDKAGMGRKYRRSKPSASIPPRSGVQQSHSYAPAALAHTKPQGNNHAQKPGNPDIMRRTIR